jgi:hypothetical protein
VFPEVRRFFRGGHLIGKWQLVLQSRRSSPPCHGTNFDIKIVVVQRKLRSLSLIMVIGYDEVGFLLLNVVKKSTKTIIVVVVALHEFSLSLQQ